MTIRELRQAGNKTRVSHYRRIQCVERDDSYPIKIGFIFQPMDEVRLLKQQRLLCPTGGYTRIEVTSPDQKEYSAVAFCSHKDAYCKKTGLKLCLERLKL